MCDSYIIEDVQRMHKL